MATTIPQKFNIVRFNRFHSPVIVHRKNEGAVTRHEFLSSSARTHLQLIGAAAPKSSAYRREFSLDLDKIIKNIFVL
jgi:hypothetical protein